MLLLMFISEQANGLYVTNEDYLLSSISSSGPIGEGHIQLDKGQASNFNFNFNLFNSYKIKFEI